MSSKRIPADILTSLRPAVNRGAGLRGIVLAAGAVCLIALVAGCGAGRKQASWQPMQAPPLTRLAEDRIPLFNDDMDLESFEKAVEASLRYFKRAAGKRPARMDDATVGIGDMEDSLIALREILGSDESAEGKQERIRETFDVYQSVGSDGNGSVLFTGYFESFLKGSLTKTDRYRYPVYGVPGDLICADAQANGQKKFGRMVDGEFVPYHSRSEIDHQGCLEGRGLELVWVDDPVELFFMHTQGSGKIELTDGSILEVGFASKNGRPFRSVAPFMIETGRITPQKKSYREIKKYLKEHPDELPEILGYNESYVFFRIVEEGPIGAIGEVLTPGRSIATDPDCFPKGALAFMRARKPVLDDEGRVRSWIPFSRFVVSQDAGGAIKGPGRVDLFCGSGRDAEMLAGSLKEKGELYFLVKKK